MTSSIGVLIAVGGVTFEPRVLELAQADDIHVVRRCVDVADVLATAASRQAQAAVVSTSLRGLDAEVVARLRDGGVVVVGVTADALSADEALLRSLGIASVAAADDLVSLAEAVRDAVRRPTLDVDGRDAQLDESADDFSEASPRAGSVIAVWGPTGAPGRSTVALGLSAELASLGGSTLLADIDVYGGSIATLLGLLDESSGLLAAARAANVGVLNQERLATHARQLGPHLSVLTGLPRADRWTEVKTVLLSSIVSVARRSYDFTVLDCGFNLEFDEEISYDTAAPRRNGATIEALESADLLLVVGAADPVGLSRLIRGVNDVSALIPATTPHVLVNRVRTSLGWSADEIVQTVTRATGLATIRLLPDDPAACDRALVHGQTLTECTPEAKLTRALRELAAEMAGVPMTHGRRWLGRTRH
ncbi:MAG: P-loop NTPase [Nocardioidaceae bacterium]